jgi:hypothetical protein
MEEIGLMEEYSGLTRGEEGYIGMRRGEYTKANLAHMFLCVKIGAGNPPTRGDQR